ncbi:MAG: hypothetical protein QXK29_05080 [Candidatus Bathyarchaeia archaeon]
MSTPIEIKCSRCGKTNVTIAKFTTGTSGEEYICEECAKTP